MNSLRIQLLHQLLDHKGAFLSGEELSQRLNVSRTAIWKHIEELRKEGYKIKAVRKQGYHIESVPHSLSASTILPHLKTEWLGQKLTVYEEVESTQHIAHRLARDGAPSGTLVIADHQTAGKGRMGRKWHSPPGTGVWMSLILRPDIPLSSTPQLTLLSSVAVLKGIHKATHVETGIKWPNDVMVGKKKVAGILTELSAETDRVNYVIIGTGINVNQTKEDYPTELSEIATSLCIEQGNPVQRNELIVQILKEWEELYEMYMKHGFAPIKSLWEANAVSIGNTIIARTLHGHYEGLAKGITEEGVLLLEDAGGITHKIYSADIETS
jgi:BirA family biotin operon repressor/biotin-[acetyl-CoA-carboxylase] ligase